jgi:hypothetical protein
MTQNPEFLKEMHGSNPVTKRDEEEDEVIANHAPSGPGTSHTSPGGTSKAASGRASRPATPGDVTSRPDTPTSPTGLPKSKSSKKLVQKTKVAEEPEVDYLAKYHMFWVSRDMRPSHIELLLP